MIINFDADGTVFDSMPAYGSFFAEILARYHGIDPNASKASYFEMAGRTLYSQFRTMIENPRFGILHRQPHALDEIPILIDEFWKYVTENYTSILPFRDAAPALGELSEHKKILSTNTRADLISKRVDHFILGHYFDHVWGVVPQGANGFHSKDEHWGAIRGVYELSNAIFRKKVILVDDGVEGIKKAKRMGIRAVGRIGTFRAEALKEAGADRVIGSLIELPEILQEFEK